MSKQKSITFGKLEIGGPRTVIIAEIADSHNGSVKTAKKMVDEIACAGADVAKFQLHLPDIEMVPNSINMWDGDLSEILKRNLFTIEMHKEMMKYCEKVGVEYLCTPFCPSAVDILEEIGVKAFKTGSGELTNIPMHRKLARISASTGKAVIVSTGMSVVGEIEDTVRVYRTEGALKNLVLMNCTSEYPPTDYQNANLGFIGKLKVLYGVHVGQSDHTMDNFTCFGAMAYRPAVLEKHFTLDRTQDGPDHAIALEPEHLCDLVEGVRKLENAFGSERTVTEEEKKVRGWAHHSIVTACDIGKRTILTPDNLIPKRPGSGIPTRFIDPTHDHSKQILGRRAAHDISQDTILTWDMIR